MLFPVSTVWGMIGLAAYVHNMDALIRRVVTHLSGVFLLVGVAWGSVLDELPVVSGGDPTGRWGGGNVSVDVYSDSLLLVGVDDLSLTILASGQLEFEIDGGYSLAYVLQIDVSLTVLGAPLQVSVRDTVEEVGTYEVDGSELRLVSVSSVDTLGFSAADDSLTITRPVPLGDLATLAATVAPDADPPIGVIGLKRILEPARSGDFNENGQVDFADFLIFADGFGATTGQVGFDARLDLDSDGTVGFVDFLEFASQFGS